MPSITPDPLALQVAKLTLDPGYRAVAAIFDGWALDCTCVGGTITPTQIATFAASLKGFSSDPALALIAPVLANLMGNCCPSVITPTAGSTTANIRKLTLDPGAARLAMVFDAMALNCCAAAAP